MRKLDFTLHLLLFAILFLLIMVSPKDSLIFVLLAQFGVGVFQVFSSLARTLSFHSFDKTIQRMLVLYWGLCAVYAAGMGALYATGLSSDYALHYFLAAWGIAFYYCYITYLLAFPKYVRTHLDI